MDPAAQMDPNNILQSQFESMLNSGFSSMAHPELPPPPMMVEEVHVLANFDFKDEEDFPDLGADPTPVKKDDDKKKPAIAPQTIVKTVVAPATGNDYAWPPGFEYLTTYSKDFFFIEEDPYTSLPQPNPDQW
jgi:hypothetical protein